MAKIISIALQKGGTGKTTTSQALASSLGNMDKRVLLVDMDAQGNLTYASNVDDAEHTLTDVLSEECSIDNTIISCKHYDLIASDSYLTNIEIAEDVPATLLSATLAPIKDQYDFIIIDTPPALGNLSFNALTASDYVIIPTEPRPFALQGIGTLYDTIKSVQITQNPSLSILGILLIKYNKRTVLNRDMRDMMMEYATKIGTTVFDTTIRESIAVPEAQTLRQPLIEYAKNSKPNQDYEAFAKEFLEKVK